MITHTPTTHTPWWRSEMRKFSAERSAALVEADRKFGRTVQAAARVRSAGKSVHTGQHTAPQPTSPDEPTSYLVAAHLDRRTRPTWPQEEEDPDLPPTSWLQ